MPDGIQIQKMFSSIAAKYDLLNHTLSGGVDRYWWYRMARESGAKEATLFLDIAAGTGDSSLALARRGASVISTDFTHEMLALSLKKAKKKKMNNLVWGFADADAQRLPFKNEIFDGITICYGIRNFQSRETAYRECLRVLKKGGQITILEFSTPASPILRALYKLYSERILPKIGQWLSGDAAAYSYLPASIKSFPNQETIAHELQSAGYIQVEWTNLTGGIVAIHKGIKE